MIYSTFYDNWNNSENCNPQPDITVIVGNSHNAAKFFAHKYVLSSRSGYFKTLFSSHEGYEAQISNISSHTFAHLLSFMYTGHLELNPINVYEIFLASDLLHVTEALNLCKVYLANGHNYALSVVKPIPLKNVIVPNAVESLRTLSYQPLKWDDKHASIFKPVPRSSASRNNAENEILAGETEKENSADKKVGEETRKVDDKAKTPQTTSSSVILDIACCDGPIKFRRVANKYYDPRKALALMKNERTFRIESTCHGCKNIFKNSRSVIERDTRTSKIESIAANQRPNELPSKTKFKKKTDNLQCHRCKTCGSKFPSYYFVHKHRKLHHRDHEDFSA